MGKFAETEAGVENVVGDAEMRSEKMETEGLLLVGVDVGSTTKPPPRRRSRPVTRPRRSSAEN